MRTKNLSAAPATRTEFLFGPSCLRAHHLLVCLMRPGLAAVLRRQSCPQATRWRLAATWQLHSASARETDFATWRCAVREEEHLGRQDVFLRWSVCASVSAPARRTQSIRGGWTLSMVSTPCSGDLLGRYSSSLLASLRRTRFASILQQCLQLMRTHQQRARVLSDEDRGWVAPCLLAEHFKLVRTKQLSTLAQPAGRARAARVRRTLPSLSCRERERERELDKLACPHPQPSSSQPKPRQALLHPGHTRTDQTRTAS